MLLINILLFLQINLSMKNYPKDLYGLLNQLYALNKLDGNVNIYLRTFLSMI